MSIPATFESRAFTAIVVLFVLVVVMLMIALEVGRIDRRVTDLETAVTRINRAHSTP